MKYIMTADCCMVNLAHAISIELYHSIPLKCWDIIARFPTVTPAGEMDTEILATYDDQDAAISAMKVLWDALPDSNKLEW